MDLDENLDHRRRQVNRLYGDAETYKVKVIDGENATQYMNVSRAEFEAIASVLETGDHG